MKHLGDITKIHGDDVPAVDVLIGGSPCQDLSVANGKRLGLNGERSGLFMEQVRIFKEMRERDRRNGASDIRPRFLVWENVAGAMSSNKGEDFRIVLQEIAKIADPEVSVPRPADGKWKNAGLIVGNGFSIAWRVLDAQFWGVPQRRRRIALVADFGESAGRAGEVLFVRSSGAGNFESRGEARQKSQGEVPDPMACFNADHRPSISFQERAGCAGGGKGLLVQIDHVGALRFQQNQFVVDYKADGEYGGDKVYAIVGDHKNRPTDMTNLVVGVDFFNQVETGDVTNTLLASRNDLIHIPCVVSLDRAAYNAGANAQFDFDARDDGIAYPVIAKGPGVVAYAYPLVGDDVVGAIDAHYSAFPGCRGGLERTMVYTAMILGTFRKGAHPRNADEGQSWLPTDKADTLNVFDNSETRTPTLVVAVLLGNTIVRRLTPLECERLQGYPDEWTKIGDYIDTQGKKRKTSDAGRYKALGNSIALPPWKWVLKRISAQYERDATMASLFDGIGGFPYLWEQINGKGSCLWASEIEEFPIAVTERRINDGR